MIRNLLFIFIGGGLGSMLRFAISSTLNQYFPYGTLIANLVGCFLIGLALGYFEKEVIKNTLFLALAVGFCGGFTTFSSFAAENLKFLQNQAYSYFFLYVLGSVVLGVLMVWLGFSAKVLWK